ncbi:hypothetical protein [Moorena producens]|uniref:hypothetical protein n=1 Tax=Moorena producens TaxID=1155739 RepID=UPI003C7445F4
MKQVLLKSFQPFLITVVLMFSSVSQPAIANELLDNSSVASDKSYTKVDFGFNKCNVQWGGLLSGVSEADMVKLATEANANGFTYHPSLNYGRIMVGDYPEDCKSPANESWPLYLVVPDQSYTKVDFGFNNCNVQWGEVLSGVSEADMLKLATEANANGFTYHPSLNYGSIMVGDYPEGCKSPTNESWPLYLKI